MNQFAENMACNELMVFNCIKELRQDQAKARNFITALLEGYTISYYGYQFTDYDTQRIYNAIKKGGAIDDRRYY